MYQAFFSFFPQKGPRSEASAQYGWMMKVLKFKNIVITNLTAALILICNVVQFHDMNCCVHNFISAY